MHGHILSSHVHPVPPQGEAFARLGRLLLPLAALAVAGLSGCQSASKSAALAELDPEIRKKVKSGVVENGFTPAMVQLALGKPSIPAQANVETTVNDTWVYNRSGGTPRDYILNGYRYKTMFDPALRYDVTTVERVGPTVFPSLRNRRIIVVFQDGKVVSVNRMNLD